MEDKRAFFELDRPFSEKKKKEEGQEEIDEQKDFKKEVMQTLDSNRVVESAKTKKVFTQHIQDESEHIPSIRHQESPNLAKSLPIQEENIQKEYKDLNAPKSYIQDIEGNGVEHITDSNIENMAKKETTTKKSIKNPKLIIERIPTSIPGFDDLIEGGYEKNSTNLLAGSPGAGKSIFAIQFLIGGIKNKEKCLYVSFEEKKEPFYANMAEFGWDLYQYEEEGLFTFLEYSPSKVKTMLDEGGGDIESIIVKRGVSRIVLDSISAFTLLFENELEKREASLSLINMIKKWNCTSLLTYEAQSVSKEQSTQFRTLDFESDSITILYLVRNKAKRERYIEVIKMRGTNHSKNTYSYEINDSGLQVAKRPTEDLPEL